MCSHNDSPSWVSANDNNMQNKGDKGNKIHTPLYTTSSTWPTSQVQLGRIMLRITLEYSLGS